MRCSRQHIEGSSEGKVGGELAVMTHTIADDMVATLVQQETGTREPAPAHGGARARPLPACHTQGTKEPAPGHGGARARLLPACDMVTILRQEETGTKEPVPAHVSEP